MKLGAKSLGFTIAATLLAAMGVAVAQQAAAPTPPPVEVGGQQDVALSPQQMLAEAKGYLPSMDRGANAVRQQLAVAREQKDVVKTLCLNDKLNQIDLAIRTATDRVDGLGAAVAQNDSDRSRHQFTVVQVLRDRVNTLVSEANQCIGEETGFVEDSAVTVEVDDSIPDEDPSEFPADPVISGPPVLSSPTR
jgi:hypothetical protein